MLKGWAGFSLLLVLLLSSCSMGPKTPVPITELGQPEPPPPSLASASPAYIIQPGDKLDVKFYYNAHLNDAVTVRPDGRISLQLVHDVQAASLTPDELALLLMEKYSPHIRDPEISVIVRSFDSQRIFVDGEVGRPGMVAIGGNYMTIMQAIASTGGLKDSALGSEVLVIRRNGLKKPFVLTVDVDDVMNGTDTTQDIVLKPYDIVYVPKSAIANINSFVDLYIRKNIPIGFSYGLYKTVE